MYVFVSMSVVKCPYCGYSVPVSYTECPICGTDISPRCVNSKTVSLGHFRWIAVALILVSIVIWGVKQFMVYNAEDKYGYLFTEEYKLVLNHTQFDIKAADSNVRYLLSTGQSELSLVAVTDDVSSFCHLYASVIDRYPEFCYDETVCEYFNGMMSVKFNSVYDEKSRIECVDNGITMAKYVKNELYRTGSLMSSFLDIEKARIYYEYIVSNCETVYRDKVDKLRDLPIEQRVYCTAYGGFMHHKADILGYCSMYNLLLRLEGIDCIVVSDEDKHVWVEAELDGTKYEIDFADGVFRPIGDK